MNVLRITGPQRLEGTVTASGSKNAALPAMAACLLTDQPVELSNVPCIEDIETMGAMLRDLGVGVDHARGSTWRLRANQTPSVRPDAELARRLRGSVLMLGPLLARTGEALIPRPGGDDIGLRRLDQHLVGLRAMGATVDISDNSYVASAHLPLHGARVDLDMPTVTGTENLMMAACLAEGITAIGNAAREPHVVDLARCLNGMGARVTGAGTEQIVVEGTGGLLHGVRHSVTSDYVEAGTYMVAAAATGGDVTLDQLAPADVRPLINKLRAAGCDIEEGTTHVRVHRERTLRAVDVTTWPHPGFATDFQPQFVTLMTQAEGTSTISEAVHDNRFRHVDELRRLGAEVTIDGRSAIVHGPAALRGTLVRVLDIRSGAALVIAACCAEGVTEIEDVFHLDRGYEALVDKLRMLGAQVEQVTRPVEASRWLG
ncbi:MAG: UDP-N-acetylglucosamine 1-carboxyvinyltransferase [Chloroflexota bacterium]|nr:UDP-N-acetylglucosamine 1-carboxyvinyltransferase [Chloroflexota bacterium]